MYSLITMIAGITGILTGTINVYTFLEARGSEQPEPNVQPDPVKPDPAQPDPADDGDTIISEDPKDLAYRIEYAKQLVENCTSPGPENQDTTSTLNEASKVLHMERNPTHALMLFYSVILKFYNCEYSDRATLLGTTETASEDSETSSTASMNESASSSYYNQSSTATMDDSSSSEDNQSNVNATNVTSIEADTPIEQQQSYFTIVYVGLSAVVGVFGLLWYQSSRKPNKGR